MKKIVLNSCYGGFGLSKAAKEYLLNTPFVDEYIEKSKNEDEEWFLNMPEEEIAQCALEILLYDDDDTDFRQNQYLVKCVEELGDLANDKYSDLYVHEYDDEKWIPSIDEYDGMETLNLIPVVRREKIEQCKSVEEIMDYLESLGICTKRREGGRGL